MRKTFWFAIIALWLGIIGFVGYLYLHAPNKNTYYGISGFVSIGRNYVNGQDIDLSQIKGNDNNAEYLKILGTCFQSLLNVNRELSKQTSLLMVLVQPRNLSSTQSIDVSLQRADDYIKLVQTSRDSTEAAFQKLSDDMLKVDRKKLIFDSVGLVDSVKAEKANREKKFQYYNGLATYIKTTIQFAKSRVGYFKISDDGNNLVFSRPVDQNYYNQLISGIGLYAKQIDQYNSRDMNIIRSQVGQAENILATAKK